MYVHEADVDVKIKPPFVIPITLSEIIATLIATKRVKGYTITDSIDLPPSATLTYTIPVEEIPKSDTEGVPQVAIPFEFTAQPDPDYSIHGTFKLDNKVLIDDTAMSADMYNKSFDFITQYSLVLFAEKTLSAIFTNTTTDDAHISFRIVFGVMKKTDYEKIVYSYATEIKDTLLKYRLPYR